MDQKEVLMTKSVDELSDIIINLENGSAIKTLRRKLEDANKVILDNKTKMVQSSDLLEQMKCIREKYDIVHSKYRKLKDQMAGYSKKIHYLSKLSVENNTAADSLLEKDNKIDQLKEQINSDRIKHEERIRLLDMGGSSFLSEWFIRSINIECDILLKKGIKPATVILKHQLKDKELKSVMSFCGSLNVAVDPDMECLFMVE